MLNIITIVWGPLTQHQRVYTTPDLVFKRRLLSLGNGADAVAAFAEQEGVGWVEVVSIEPVPEDAAYVDLDPVLTPLLTPAASSA